MILHNIWPITDMAPLPSSQDVISTLAAIVCQWGDCDHECSAAGIYENIMSMFLITSWNDDVNYDVVVNEDWVSGNQHSHPASLHSLTVCSLPNSWRADDGTGYLLENILGLCVINAHFWSHHQHPVFGDVIARRTQTIPVEGRVWNEAVSALVSASWEGVQNKIHPKSEEFFFVLKDRYDSFSILHTLVQQNPENFEGSFLQNQSFSAIHRPQVLCSMWSIGFETQIFMHSSLKEYSRKMQMRLRTSTGKTSIILRNS